MRFDEPPEVIERQVVLNDSPARILGFPSPAAPLLKKSQYLFPSFIFLVFLSYFVAANGWFIPARLVVSGTAPTRSGKISVSWDSGEGFNTYETRQFTLDPAAKKGKTISIEIRFTDEKNPASLGKNVVLQRVSADGRHLKFSDIGSGSFRKNKSGRLVLSRRGDRLQLQVGAKRHVRIEFTTNRYAGKVFVSAFGRSKSIDLYSDNRELRKLVMDYWLVLPDGSFKVSMRLPRYRINRVVISRSDRSRPLFLKSVAIASRRGVRKFDVETQKNLDSISLDDVNRGLKGYFDPQRFLWQILFSGLSTWMLVALWRRMQECGGLKSAFLEEKRYVFWALLLGVVVVFGLWLAALWPGVMSIDSLKIWRAAKLPDVAIKDHPVINVVFYMYLMQLWDNSAVVPAAQIGLTALLSAWIFFSLYRRNVPVPMLLLFYFPLVFSIPAGLYSCTLWKDVPFALLVVFWAFTLGEIYQRQNRGMLKLSPENLTGYGFLFMALVFTRFNGLVYIGVIPVLLACMKVLSVRKLAGVAALCILAVGVFYFFRPGNSAVENIHYVSQQSGRLFKELKDQPLKRQAKQFARRYFRIFDINQKMSRWDLWHYFLKDRYAYTFLKRSGWWDVYPYANPERRPLKGLYRAAINLYHWSYEKPQVYFTWNPFYMLAFFPLVTMLFYYLPRSALFSAVIMVQVITMLFILKILNWRYYYFAYLAAFFLIPTTIGEILSKLRPVQNRMPAA